MSSQVDSTARKPRQTRPAVDQPPPSKATASAPEATASRAQGKPPSQGTATGGSVAGKHESQVDKAVEGYSQFLKDNYNHAQELKNSSNPVEQLIGTTSAAASDAVTATNNHLREAGEFYANSDNAFAKHAGGAAVMVARSLLSPVLIADHTQSASEIKSNALDTAITVGTLGAGKLLGLASKVPLVQSMGKQAARLGGAVLDSPLSQAVGRQAARLGEAVLESPLGRELVESAPKWVDEAGQALGKLNRAPEALVRQLPGGNLLLEAETGARQVLARVNHFGHTPGARAGMTAALQGDAALRNLDSDLQQQVLSRMDSAPDLFTQQHLSSLVRTEGFARQSPPHQRQLLALLDQAPSNPKLLRNAQALASDSNFNQLSDATRSMALAKLLPLATEPSSLRNLTQLYTSAGFRELSEETQQQLLRYVGGTNPQVSAPARKALAHVQTPEFWLSSAGDQADRLKDFMKEQPGALDVASSSHGSVPRLPHSLSAPRDIANVPFQSGVADAQQYLVGVGKDTIPVYVSKNVDTAALQMHDIDEVAQGLAALPPNSRKVVNEVFVEGKPNPHDSYWAKQYNDPDFSSYMTAGADGRISIYPSKHTPPQEVLDGSLIHETGHTISKRLWGNSPSPSWSVWESAASKDQVVASQYAKAHIEEDFSETLVLYQQVRGTPLESELRELMPERFKILDVLVGS